MSDAPIVTTDRYGTLVYRASMFGGCERMLTAARLGFDADNTPSARMAAVYTAGHDAEDWFVGTHDAGVVGSQDEVTLSVPGRHLVLVRGHVDGYRATDTIPLSPAVVEIKSQSPDLYDAWTPDSWTTDALWRKYAWQVSAYMLATGRQLDLVRIRRGDEYEFQITRIEVPFHDLAAFQGRVARLDELADAGTLPPCDTTLTFSCPFWKYHEEREMVEDEDLEIVASNYQMAKAAEKYAKNEVERWKKELVAILGDRTDVLTLGGWSVKHTTFDVKEKHIKAGSQTRLTVTKS